MSITLKKILSVLIACVCIICTFSACGKTASATLSDEEIMALREEYPYIQDDSLGSQPDVPKIDEILERIHPAAYLSIEIVDAEPLAAELELDATGGRVEGFVRNVQMLYIPAKIIEVIEARNGYSFKEDIIWITFNKSKFDDYEIFEPGNRFVFCATEMSEEFKDAIGKEQVFGGSSLSSFYLTDSGHLLSMCSDDNMEVYTGRTLESFKTEMASIAKSVKW